MNYSFQGFGRLSHVNDCQHDESAPMCEQIDHPQIAAVQQLIMECDLAFVLLALWCIVTASELTLDRRAVPSSISDAYPCSFISCKMPF
jgi:hypothetical protein